MSSTRWASGTVAGVTLQDSGGRDLRVDVLDAEALKGSLVGSSVFALDLTVHSQILSRVSMGVKFGVHMVQVPVDKLSAIVAAMEQALAASETFPVVLSDAAGTDDIDVACVLDFEAAAGKPYQRGAIAAGYVKDVVIRFISTGPNV